MFKETKFYFENMFSTNWNATPIHYGGQEFNSENIDTWINIVMKPVRSEPASISGGLNKYAADFYVVCWAENDVKCMELGDTITDFMEANTDTNKYSVNRYRVIDHGWQDNNEVFMVLSFSLNIYNGICA